MRTLGIWDGHDAGAAIVMDGEILFAINEERLSRRKLEVGFPLLSIQHALETLSIKQQEIDEVAISTTDLAKTLTRLFPSLREEYYQMRRRKKLPGTLSPLKKFAKYKLTEMPSTRFSQWLSTWNLASQLQHLGLGAARLSLIDHHHAHAAAAAKTSGFSRCTVLTIDGIGDGSSGSVWTFRDGVLRPVTRFDGRASLGIFFEHVTNLLNMRELEDEGKIMALANFSFPIPDQENPMHQLFEVNGLKLSSPYSSTQLYRKLRDILWQFPSEQFAYMAQRTLEIHVVQLIKNALSYTQETSLAYAGGVAANVKVNMLIRELPQVTSLYVYPHMGDGGLAVGAALASQEKIGTPSVSLTNIFLGPESDSSAILKTLAQYPELEGTEIEDIEQQAALLIASGKIIFWFQGRMEYGPRALGGRSILALPNSTEIKDQLNVKLKKRVWYQPFCPSLLHSDAIRMLKDYSGPVNPFMTCAYRIRDEFQSSLQGAMGPDGTCRPQILIDSGNDLFTKLLLEVKRQTGNGAVLNTSFNLHGEPMVCTPEDAFRTFQLTEVSHLVIGKFLVTKRTTSY